MKWSRIVVEGREIEVEHLESVDSSVVRSWVELVVKEAPRKLAARSIRSVREARSLSEVLEVVERAFPEIAKAYLGELAKLDPVGRHPECVGARSCLELVVRMGKYPCAAELIMRWAWTALALVCCVADELLARSYDDLDEKLSCALIDSLGVHPCILYLLRNCVLGSNTVKIVKVCGTSMEPTLSPGDLVVLKPLPIAEDVAKEVNVGDIVTRVLSPPTPSVHLLDGLTRAAAPSRIPSVAMHRAVAKFRAPCYACNEATWFITKGDNNEEPDPPIPECGILYKAIKVVKKGTREHDALYSILAQ